MAQADDFYVFERARVGSEGEARAYKVSRVTGRAPKCPVCGDNPTITALIDYDQFCGAPGAQH